MAPKQPPRPEFQDGERVLCFHGPLLYEAKCLRVASEDKQVRYLVHYSGWNKNWDEWVPESRVLKYSEANLQKQRDLQRANQEQRARGAAQGRRGSAVAAASLQQQQQSVEALFQNIRITPSTSAATATSTATATATATASGEAPGRHTRKSKQKTGAGEGRGCGGSTSTARGAPQAPQRRRARGHPSAKDAGASAPRAEARVQIPAELKPLLVQDWDLVTHRRQLFSLPAKKNVDAILEEYVTYKTARGEGDNAQYAAEEMAKGIRAHFNVLLGTQLLCDFERPQYAELLATHPGLPASQLYGAPHLLRLFVRIGAILARSPFDDRSLAALFGYLHDFLNYLAQDPSAFFDASEYKEAPPEYNQRVA